MGLGSRFRVAVSGLGLEFSVQGSHYEGQALLGR